MILFIAFCCLYALKANAGIAVVYGDGDKISLVKELPKSEEFIIQDADDECYHANLGVKYEQFSLFYIPIWNYGDYTYVLYAEDKKGEYLYASLSEEDIALLQSVFGGIPDIPKLPFWDSVGGKLLILGIIIFFCFLGYRANKE